MPSTIPYDPSLILGNIVPKEKLENIIQISKLQAPVDAAEANLNSLITLKRSIDMTIQEMVGMGVDASPVMEQSKSLDRDIQKAVISYAKIKLTLVDLFNYFNLNLILLMNRLRVLLTIIRVI